MISREQKNENLIFWVPSNLSRISSNLLISHFWITSNLSDLVLDARKLWYPSTLETILGPPSQTYGIPRIQNLGPSHFGPLKLMGPSMRPLHILQNLTNGTPSFRPSYSAKLNPPYFSYHFGSAPNFAPF